MGFHYVSLQNELQQECLVHQNLSDKSQSFVWYSRLLFITGLTQ
jgi:hypothetical protein